jgi:hypothetical protein
MMETFNWGEAQRHMAQGARVARKGWNGKDMWACLIAVSEWSTTNIHYRMNAEITRRPFYGLKAVDGTFGPWQPNNLDLLGEDWYVVET